MSELTKEMLAVQNAISCEDYEAAEKLFCDAGVSRESDDYNDLTAILDASLGAALGDRERTWEAIRAGLAYNCKNYELYVMLGNYYLEENLKQAYLCYENALHHCDVEEDGRQIQALMDQLIQEYQVKVNRAAFVILSFDLLEYTKPCIESIRDTVPESAREIIVVDNASKDGSVEWLREQKDIKLVANEENKGFPIGCNQGIAAAEADSDIFLLNNDTLMAENSLFWLRMGLYASENVGTTGSVSNNVPNLQMVARELQDTDAILEFGRDNNIPMKYPYEEKLFLIGFALLIKRSVLDEIGLLDEQFTPGNSEDEDYGFRVIKAGYKNILCKNSFILHFGHRSFAKAGEQNFASVLLANRQKLDQKWGMDTSSYIYLSPEIINIIKEPAEKNLRMLDVGCGCGAAMRRLGGLYPNAELYGIERNPIAAEFAMSIGEVICADVESLQFPWEDSFFDYVVIGNELGYVKDPQMLLKKVYRVLKQNGRIIVCVANIKHFSVFLPLLTHDVFPCSVEGGFDTAYLKMYTRGEILKLLRGCGYTPEEMLGVTASDPNEYEEKLINQLADMTEKTNKTPFLVRRYIVRAVKSGLRRL